MIQYIDHKNSDYKDITEYLNLIALLDGIKTDPDVDMLEVKELAPHLNVGYVDVFMTSSKRYKHEIGKASIRNLDVNTIPIADEYFNIPKKLKSYINDDYHYFYGMAEYEDNHCIWHQKAYEIYSKQQGNQGSRIEGNIELFKYRAIRYAKYSKYEMLRMIRGAKGILTPPSKPRPILKTK